MKLNAAREVKIGLSLLAILTVVLGVVAVRRLTKATDATEVAMAPPVNAQPIYPPQEREANGILPQPSHPTDTARQPTFQPLATSKPEIKAIAPPVDRAATNAANPPATAANVTPDVDDRYAPVNGARAETSPPLPPPAVSHVHADPIAPAFVTPANVAPSQPRPVPITPPATPSSPPLVAIGPVDTEITTESTPEPSNAEGVIQVVQAAEVPPTSRPAPRPLPPAAMRDGTETIGPAQATGSYEVQPNDSYWTISERIYGSGAYFRALSEANRGTETRPDRLAPGSVLATPPVAQLEREYPDLCPQADRHDAGRARADAGVGGGSSYMVQEGDTLSSIARNELGKVSRWAEVYQLNRDALGKEYETLTPGMQLTLPLRGAQPADRTARTPGGTPNVP